MKKKYSIALETTVKKKPKIKAGEKVGTSNLHKTFYKAYTTNWRYDLYTLIKITDDTIPCYYLDSSWKM